MATTLFEGNECTVLLDDLSLVIKCKDKIKLCINLSNNTKPATNKLTLVSKAADSITYDFSGLAKLQINKRQVKHIKENAWSFVCYDVTWTPISSDFVAIDAVKLSDGFWYGGAEMFEQHWPINAQFQPMMPFVTNDFFQGKGNVGDLLERFWICSTGVGVYVDDSVPLHTAFNVNNNMQLLLKADYNNSEYKNTNKQQPVLRYTVGVADDIRKLWISMYRQFYELPSGVPDERMFKSPIWSTWAQYKVDITQDKVMELANQILKHGFTNSQLELDDMYTTKYGDFVFNPEKFPNPEKMIKDLRELGFRFTTWMHPFANEDSKAFAEGAEKGYWVKDASGAKPGLTKWWQGFGGIIDVTNPEARQWFVSRLKSYQQKYGIDSFKFDAGETNWLPKRTNTKEALANPTEYTTQYVDMVADFGPMIETRVGFKSQRHPIFVRMMDKHSAWGYGNGLQTMIPTALLMSMLGYPFILPDMIGGNGYVTEEEAAGEWAHTTKFPPKELLIRWTQVSAYLPSMQFSLVPWQYDEETVRICKEAVQVHEKVVTPIVLGCAQEATKTGYPIIRPLWWHDPIDHEALRCDSQFLVGDSLLVAPVLHDGARQRHVYVPLGTWGDNLRGGQHVGPVMLENYAVGLDEVATFTLETSKSNM